MAESWKVEQTCVPVPSPVMDSSAPCANYEARKEWAERECHMVSCLIRHFIEKEAFHFFSRFSINQKRIHFYLVLKSSMKLLYEHSTSNVFMMLASMSSILVSFVSDV